MKRAALIINPASGREYPILAKANNFFSETKIEWDVYITQKSKRTKLKKRYDYIIVYGGDGTFTEIAQNYADIPILPLHGGTANTLQKELGIPKNPEEALRLLLKPKIVKMDSMIANGRQFYSKIQSGIHIERLDKVTRNSKNIWGYLAYLSSVLRTAASSKPKRFDIKSNNFQKQIDADILVISNTGSIGIQSLAIDRGVSAFDGHLDLFLLKNKPMNIASVIVSKLFWTGKSRSIHKRVKSLNITTKERSLWHLDDERFIGKNMDIEIKPSSTKVIVPK
jgi:diacylglycerol kinase family enzyme